MTTNDDWTIDRICALTTRPEFLAALNACRPGTKAKRPWRAAYFAAIHGHYLELSAAAIDWLRQQAQAELDAIQE